MSDKKLKDVLLSKARSAQLRKSLGSTAISFVRPEAAPAVWSAVAVAFFHNISMGAALMVWIDVCRASVGDATGTAGQTLYGRLLAVNAICELLTSLVVGGLSDQYGRRPLQISAQVGQLVDYTTAALVLPSLGMAPFWQVPLSVRTPLLYMTRGFAGLAGNFRVSLQSYTTDISSASDCPKNLAYVGAAIVLGMCIGGGFVAAVDITNVPYRVCYYVAVAANTTCILFVVFLWRDIAPTKKVPLADMNPIAGIKIFQRNSALLTYAVLIFLASFALNIYTSTIAFYTETFLGMSKATFSMLGLWWAFVSAVCLAIIQPWLCTKYGELRALQVSFFALVIYFILFSILEESTWWAAFLVMPFFSLSTISYPLAVGLATREVDLDEQGKLQGAVSVMETTGKILAPLLASDVLIPMFQGPGQFHGMVFLVAAVVVSPGILLTFQQTQRMTRHSQSDAGQAMVELS